MEFGGHAELLKLVSVYLILGSVVLIYSFNGF
jgi:hypothetical protein